MCIEGGTFNYLWGMDVFFVIWLTVLVISIIVQYLEQEGLSYLLQFVIAADNFEDMLRKQENYNGVQAQGDAMVLYDKYV